MSTVSVEVAAEVTEELVADVARLLPQLSSSAPAPSAAELGEVVASDGAVLFLAREAPGAPALGMLTLVTYRIPTGVHAVIEDVVVDQAARGRGVGQALMRAALEEAHRRGSRHVDLTSRPSREAANRLYQRVGFVIRETNVYRHTER